MEKTTKNEGDTLENGLPANSMEICVLCGKQLDVPILKPIELRESYIIGCGQLCRDCFHSVARRSRTDDRTKTELDSIAELAKKRIK